MAAVCSSAISCGAKADGRVKALAEPIPKASNSKPFMVMRANLRKRSILTGY